MPPPPPPLRYPSYPERGGAENQASTCSDNPKIRHNNDNDNNSGIRQKMSKYAQLRQIVPGISLLRTSARKYRTIYDPFVSVHPSALCQREPSLTGRLPDDGRFNAPGRTAKSGDRGAGLDGCPGSNPAGMDRDEPAVPVPARELRGGVGEENRPLCPPPPSLPLPSVVFA